MNMSFEDQIRERAYQIWEAGGMADGQSHEHWCSAEQAVRGEQSAEPEVILTKAASKPQKAKPAKTAVEKAAKAKVAAKIATKAPRASKAKKVELSASA